ncbi:MAG: MBL fold metallo-hydrolase [Polyangiaceae bacterium]
MRALAGFLPAIALGLVACGPPPPPQHVESPGPALTADAFAGPDRSPPRCQAGAPMKVHFYDAGQALSVLVTLPDGRHILVDAGESARRPGCTECKEWHQRVMEGLRKDLGTGVLDLLWITHQHSDHLGGAPDVIEAFHPKTYVDNGLDIDRERGVVKDARDAAAAANAVIHVVSPEHPESPLPGTASVKLTPIVPKEWPAACHSDPNACSIGLRVDYCQSSVLFLGDAPKQEEEVIDARGTVTLLQVGHHGAETSTGLSFVKKLSPKYAVISSAKPQEGTNDGYCHPRGVTVRTLTGAMGGAGTGTVKAFDGKTCSRKEPKPEEWSEVPASDHLWVTARDGGVTLTTTGDGVFTKE